MMRVTVGRVRSIGGTLSMSFCQDSIELIGAS